MSSYFDEKFVIDTRVFDLNDESLKPYFKFALPSELELYQEKVFLQYSKIMDPLKKDVNLEILNIKPFITFNTKIRLITFEPNLVERGQKDFELILKLSSTSGL